jgi:hypothetical protein
LQAAVEVDVPGATVRNLRPDALEQPNPPPQVNVYLYQVTPNAAWRNADLPTRRDNGSLVQRPYAALDLQYLLSFYGDEADLEPQRLLGRTVSLLHARPVLTREAIRSAIDAAVAADPNHFLATSNLDEQVEMVRFTPLSMNLEELSRLWSVFFQTPYALSVAYQGTVVLIEQEETAAAALPVRARNLYVEPFDHPEIERVVAQGGAGQPIVIGGTLLVQGRRLRGEITMLRVGGAEVSPTDVTDTQIQVQLAAPPFPAGSLRAGVQGVQVIHQRLMGTPPVAHPGVESNAVAFVLRPVVTGASVANVQGTGTDPRSADATLQLNPIVGSRQRVVLLLNERVATNPRAYTFVAPPRATDSTSITIPVTEVRAASYVVRVQVDGAESLLTVDTNQASPTFNQYIGPQVTIP